MRNTLKVLFVAAMISPLIMGSALSYAFDHNGGGHGYGHDGWHGHSYVGVNFSVWPDNYYYGAPYYYPADEVLVSPPVYEPVVINEAPETVIQQPATVIEPAAPVITSAAATSDIPDSITINIPNDKGGYTAVALNKSGNGFIGPQGEFYPQFPRVSQLKVIYGK
jgi:hypothetical protein